MFTKSDIGLRAFLPTLIAAAAGLAVSAPVRAQDYTWKNGMSGGWPVMGNWDQAGIPNSTLPGTSTLIARANAAVGMAANQGVYDLRINHATSALTITNNAQLRYNATSPLGVTIDDGSLNVVQGKIVKGVAGAKPVSMRGKGKLTAEGTSAIESDITLSVVAGPPAQIPQFRVIAPGNGPVANVTVTGNIANAGIVSIEPRTVPGFNSPSIRLTLGTATAPRTITNSAGAKFDIYGGAGSRSFSGSIVNLPDAEVNVGGAALFDNAAATYTNRGLFRVGAGISDTLTIRGAGAVRPLFTQAENVLDAGGQNAIGFGAAKFRGDTIRFAFNAGEIVNGPVELKNSHLSFADMCCVDSKIQIVDGTTTMLTQFIPMGVTVSVLGSNAGASAQLSRAGALTVQGRLILHSVAAGAQTPRTRLSMAVAGVPQTLTNEGDVYIGFPRALPGPGEPPVGESDVVLMTGVNVVNKGSFAVAGETRMQATIPGVAAQAANFDNTAGATFSIYGGKQFIVGFEVDPAPMGSNSFTNRMGAKCEGKGTVWVWGSNGRKGKWQSSDVSKIKPGTTIVPFGDSADFEPGIFTIDADFEQRDQAEIDIAVSGPGYPGSAYSQLVVTGAADLGGVLRISCDDPSFLGWGDVMTVMTYAARTGDFDQFVAPSLPSFLRWFVAPGSVAYRVGVRHIADVTHDGRVDIFDLNWVLSQYTQHGDVGPIHRLTGDANEDGVVDFLDLNIVIGAFGAVAN